MTTVRTRLKGVIAAEETTYGTDASPATSDGVTVEENFWADITIDHLNDNLRDESTTSGLGRAGVAESTGQFAEFDLVCPLKGAGSAYSATGDLEFDPLMQACGMSATVDTTADAETITYAPTSTPDGSVSVYLYAGNTEYQLVGCRGNAVLLLTPGMVARVRFEMQGLVSSINDTGVPSITYANSGVTKPPVVQTAGLTLNSHDPSGFSDLEFNPGMNVVERPRGNAADAHDGYVITDIVPELSATIDRPDLANLNFWDLRDNGTTFSGDVGDIGSTQYNKFNVSWPALRVTDVPQSADNGMGMLDVTMRAHNSDIETADDSYSIVFD